MSELAVTADGPVMVHEWNQDEPAEIAVKVGDEWVALGEALAGMEARLLAAIAYACRVPEVHPR